MKKLLLTLAVAAMTLMGNAQNTAVFNADGNTYSGDSKNIVTVSGTTDKEGDNALISKTFTVPGALTLKFAMGTNTSNAPGVGTWKHIRSYVNNTITITPEAGTTINGVTIRFTTANYAKTFNVNTGTFALDGAVGTWTGSTTEALVLTTTATCRYYYIEVSYEGGQVAVETPTFSLESAFVNAGTEVELACATEGAEIRYTLDGTTPDANSALYSAPIKIEGKTVINAIGMKSGAVNSNVATAAYGVIFVGDNAENATYDFVDVTTLNPAQTKPEAGGEIAVADIKFVAGDVEISFAGESSTPSRIFCSSADATTLRLYTGSTMTFAATNEATINSITFEADPFGLQLAADAPGYIIGNTWTAEAADVTAVNLTSAANSTITKITVNYSKKADGISGVAVDTDAAAEYYNLQGIRMQGELAPGLYIRREGNKASKIIVR